MTQLEVSVLGTARLVRDSLVSAAVVLSTSGARSSTGGGSTLHEDNRAAPVVPHGSAQGCGRDRLPRAGRCARAVGCRAPPLLDLRPVRARDTADSCGDSRCPRRYRSSRSPNRGSSTTSCASAMSFGRSCLRLTTHRRSAGGSSTSGAAARRRTRSSCRSSDGSPAERFAPSAVRIQLGAHDSRHWVANIERARIELGWAPTVDLEAGLRSTISWWQ